MRIIATTVPQLFQQALHSIGWLVRSFVALRKDSSESIPLEQNLLCAGESKKCPSKVQKLNRAYFRFRVSFGGLFKATFQNMRGRIFFRDRPVHKTNWHSFCPLLGLGYYSSELQLVFAILGVTWSVSTYVVALLANPTGDSMEELPYLRMHAANTVAKCTELLPINE